MYESRPKERQGKPLHSIVAEAIENTASTEGEKTEVGAPRRHAPQSGPAPSPLVFTAVTALAVIEALVIILLLAF